MAATVFFSYSHADEALRDQLERQLSILQRQGVIETWHDRRIGAGENFGEQIDQHLEEANIILLLVSSDFLASDYCHDIEMTRALERHVQGSAIVIPVILRDCLWHRAPFGKLLATPPDGRAVTRWPDRDQALTEVARAIEAAAVRLKAADSDTVPSSPAPAGNRRSATPHGPRSSNLRLAKSFTDRDKALFRDDAFEYIARFFENSLAELANRNPDVEYTFRRIDANRFTAAVYQNGKAVVGCTVFIGAGFSNGIAFVYSETTESNSYNEILTVDSDNQMLYLRNMGMAHFASTRDAKLSEEGAAELYWSMLISRLQ